MKAALKRFAVIVMLVVAGLWSSVSAEPNFGYKPADNVVYYLGGDERGLMEFYSDACPFVDPQWKLAKFFHLGVTMAAGQFEPFCWARADSERVGIIVSNGDQFEVQAKEMKRGPAPLPQAMNEVGV